MSGVKLAPDYAFYKVWSAAPTTAQLADKNSGLNFDHFNTGMIQVLPFVDASFKAVDSMETLIARGYDFTASADNPTLTILVWSPAAGKFIASNPAKTQTGAGAGVAYEVEVAAQGRIILPYVSTAFTANNHVAILAAAASMESPY